MKKLILGTMILGSFSTFANNAKVIHIYGVQAKTAFNHLASLNEIIETKGHDGATMIQSIKADYAQCEYVTINEEASRKSKRLLKMHHADGYECTIYMQSNGQTSYMK